jgi:hypothetical protein
MATLDQFAATATTSTVLRRPARDRDDDSVICPECGQDVAESKRPQSVSEPTLSGADRDLDLSTLVVYGWRCQAHSYDVVLPARATGRDAPQFLDGWVGVLVRTVDGVERWVPTPAKELPDEYLAMREFEAERGQADE